MSREQAKAAHYTQLLDEARCQGNWNAVPELVRKIRKHAPNRICLAVTADAEHAVFSAGFDRPNTPHSTTARPLTAASNRLDDISQFIPLLLDTIEKETTFEEDEFQASVCLGWIHWLLGDPELAITRLPKSIEQEFSQLDGSTMDSSEWTRVCALKASYVKGNSQVRTGAIAQALETYESAMPIIPSITSRHGKELWTWTELFLTGFCLLSSDALKAKITPIMETETLSAFRAWGKFWDSQSQVPTGGRAVQAEASRRHVWKEYYVTLSDLLQRELPFPTTSLTTAFVEMSTRLQQMAELKRVETRYENLLLSEVYFPKADQACKEVEEFVEMVMQNWRILCGSTWQEHDLGEGGSESVSRGVLDNLYRAATKTFHSTAILRHLFAVHLAIADFDLALRAFDTYLEIVKKGKARVEKTGEAEHGLDDDETVIRTVSEAIMALCRYGSRQGAEKAKELGHYLEVWLNMHHTSTNENEANIRAPENGHGENPASAISPKIIAMAWRCIGISHAQLARLTYDALLRGDIQLKAIQCFRKALSPEYESVADVETLFALGTILAERRELSPAIEVVKAGLLPHREYTTNQTHGLGPQPGRFTRERTLVPMWHLMALLLSARQEFMTAARSCEGAFEQFQDPKYLFGEDELNNGFRSDHLNEKAAPRNLGVVDEMDDFEKQSVLEVKMTQLTLIEVLEGPEIAVNASDELLSLYTRLFGDPQHEPTFSIVPGTAIPPQSSAGTIRSIKGSIFGRTGRSLRKPNSAVPTINEQSNPRPQTTQTIASTIAPTIQVTGETKSSQGQVRNPTTGSHHEKLQKRSGGVSQKTSIRNRSSSTGRKQNAMGASNSPQNTITGFTATSDFSTRSPKPLPLNTQQLSHKEPALKSTHEDSTISQDIRLPSHPPSSSLVNPAIRFPKDQEKRRRTAILVKVWLLISGFYRRANMFEDSKGAIEEAQVLVQNLEADVARDATGGVSLENAGWGGSKSLGELWADVLSERGTLAVSEANPYNALNLFESALTKFEDHPSAIVGLSNILLDIYSKDLLPPPPISQLVKPHDIHTPSASTLINLNTPQTKLPRLHAMVPSSSLPSAPQGPLGLPSPKSIPASQAPTTTSESSHQTSSPKELSTVALDRLAARDRAYGLLSSLTKLGTGWNYSEAWFALARAHEEGGQLDKAREILWWCVELEEGRAVRNWSVVGSGGYVL